MKRISRRIALKLVVPWVGATALAGETSTTADDAVAGPTTQTERILVGPFNIGDLYAARRYAEKGKGQALGDELLPSVAGPDDLDVTESLKGCWLYLIDERLRHLQKRQAWTFANKESPKVAVEGRLFHEFKNPGGEDFLIVLTAFKAAGTETIIRKDITPHRITELSATTTFRGSRGDFHSKATSWCDLGRIGYDINGKIIEPLKSTD